MKKTIIILSFLFVSCQKTPHPSQPIKFYAGKDHKYSYHIILGSDTQTVDKAYAEDYKYLLTHSFLLSGNHTLEDSFMLESALRKYYISKNLENSIQEYMRDSYNNQISCVGLGKFTKYYYEFTFNNKKDKPLNFCIDNLEIAKSYFKGLKRTIENSSKDTNQSKLILFDLNSLINANIFHLSTHQKQILILLKNANPQKEKKEIQKMIDKLEYQDSLKQQKFQNN